jgi:hypothetical protein
LAKLVGVIVGLLMVVLAIFQATLSLYPFQTTQSVNLSSQHEGEYYLSWVTLEPLAAGAHFSGRAVISGSNNYVGRYFEVYVFTADQFSNWNRSQGSSPAVFSSGQELIPYETNDSIAVNFDRVVPTSSLYYFVLQSPTVFSPSPMLTVSETSNTPPNWEPYALAALIVLGGIVSFISYKKN